MAAKTDINHYLELARKGYHDKWDATKMPIWSSNNYCAYLAGQYMKATGRSEPWEVRKSRGYYWFINDMRYLWQGLKDAEATATPEKTFVRVD